MGEKEQELKDSFEERYGQDVKQMEALKERSVYCIHTKHDLYILKCFKDASALHWQEKCLQQLAEKGAKGIVPFLPNLLGSCDNSFSNGSYAVMPFIPGRALQAGNVTEMMHGFRLLASFHQYGRGIYGKPQMIPYRSSILEKWSKRVQLFKETLDQTEESFAEQSISAIIRRLGTEAVSWAEAALENIPEAYLLYLEEQAQWERQIAHLDVVPHNFLVLESKFYYLIDYDLVDYAPPFLDVVQFLNRVLSYHDWSYDLVLRTLAEYRSCYPHQTVQENILYAMLIYPQDIFREWLGVFQRQTGYHPENAWRYLKRMEHDWEKRKRFVQQCLAVLK